MARRGSTHRWVSSEIISARPIFSGYRMVLVKDRKYPAGKAFFQIGAAALFFMLLLPWAKGRYQAPADAVELLFTDSSPTVRALAAEVARYRPDGRKYGHRLATALSDPIPAVREEAHRSLVTLSATDLGPPDDPSAVKAWREKYP